MFQWLSDPEGHWATYDEIPFNVVGSAADLNHGYFEVERTLIPRGRWPRNKVNSNDFSGWRGHVEVHSG